MIIFIRGVSELTQKKELWDFVSPALVSRMRLLNGKVIKTEILILQNKRTKLVEFHGLVYVNSEKAGNLAIKKLNGSIFKGKRAIVREYVVRSWKNDKRLNHADKVDPMLLGTGRRFGDRRRDLEQIKDMSDMFTAVKNESRKLL